MLTKEMFQKQAPAFSNFLISGLCLLELREILPMGSGVIMMIQFLVIHSFAFVFFAGFWLKNPFWKTRVFWALILFYTAFAWKIDKLSGVLQYAGLTFSTYYGFMVKREPDAAGQLGARWLTAFVLFLTLMGMTGMSGDMDAWRSSGHAPLFAFWYYLLIGALEKSGFYENEWILLIDKYASGKLSGAEIEALTAEIGSRLQARFNCFRSPPETPQGTDGRDTSKPDGPGL